MTTDPFTLMMFVHAIKSDSLSDVRFILQREPTLIDAMLTRGHYYQVTALHLAAKLGLEDMVREFLAKGVNIRQQNLAGSTPLHSALRNEAEVVATILADLDSTNDIQDMDGNTPLHLAAMRGYVEIMKKLLEAGANTRLQNIKGETPLHRALNCNSEKAAEVLVNVDSGNDFKNTYGETPLHLAAERGYEGIVKKLLAAGANTRLQNFLGATPLHYALSFREENTAELIMDVDNGNDLQDSNGETPLHYAAEKGLLGIVQKLLASGADIRVQAASGQTPLHSAILAERSQVAEFLVDLDAVNNVVDGYGWSPLNWAVRKQLPEVVRKLLLHNVHPHMKDSNGIEPLWISLKLGKNEITKYLLASCALRGIANDWKDLTLDADSIRYGIEIQDQIRVEIQLMQKTKLHDNATISYYNLAKASVHKVARYLGNEDIRNVLHQNTFLDFPNYADLISFKVQKAKIRKIRIDQCSEGFDILNNYLPPFSRICADIVMHYLNEEGMQKFVETLESSL